jgi:hypothetical protein
MNWSSGLLAENRGPFQFQCTSSPSAGAFACKPLLWGLLKGSSPSDVRTDHEPCDDAQSNDRNQETANGDPESTRDPTPNAVPVARREEAITVTVH